MDYILFICGLVMLYKRNYPWLFVIITVLATTYLHLPLKQEMRMMIGPEHNVNDIGLLLYLVFFANEVLSRGFYMAHSLAKVTAIFLLFLLLNGFVDIFSGVTFGDVIRYWKNWAYLSFVFIHIQVTKDDIRKMFVILYWITFCLCFILTIQYIIGVTWIGYSTLYNEVHVRGAMPPITVLLSFCFAVFNVFGYTKSIRIVSIVLFSLSIIFCLKMSYFIFLFMTLMVIYYLKNRSTDVSKLLKYILVTVFSITALFITFPVFYQRFQDTVSQSQIGSKQSKDGNFIYRINHFSERLDYILQDPVRSVRGLGYVQERNFHEKPFKYGQVNNWGWKSMLDTDDISWSLLIIRLGLLGIGLYLLFYGKCLQRLWKKRKNNKLVLVYFSYMLCWLLFLSLGESMNASSNFFIIPLLLINTEYEDSTLYLES